MKTTSFFLFFFIFSLPTYVFASKSTCIDSLTIVRYDSEDLLNALNNEQTIYCEGLRSAQLVVLSKITDYFYKEEFENCHRILNHIKQYPADSSILIKVYFAEGQSYYIQDNNHKAVEQFTLSLNLLKQQRIINPDAYITTSLSLASALRYDNNHEGAFKLLDTLTPIIKLAPQPKRGKYEFFVNNNIGLILKNQTRFDEAIEYFDKASNAVGVTNEDMGVSLSNKMNVLSSLKRWPVLIQTGQDILQLELKKVWTNMLVYRGLVKGNTQLNKIDKANKWLEEFRLYVEQHYSEKNFDLYNRTAADYFFLNNNCVEASKHLALSMTFSRKNHKKNNLNNSWKKKLICDVSNYDKSTSEELIRYLNYTDTLRDQYVDQIVNKWETKYKTGKKEFENQNLKKDQALSEAKIARQKLWLSVVAAILLAILSSAIFFYINARRRKKNNQLLADKNKILADQKEHIELLNRELSHRSNSNLTLIHNLLRFQKEQIEGFTTEEILEQHARRVSALASVQRHLSSNKEQATDYKKTIQSLAMDLVDSHIPSITIDTELSSALVLPDQLTSLSLIINELITNSIKYAFGQQSMPKISIKSELSLGHIAFEYRDNGSGQHDEVLGTGRGMGLVELFVRQLNGRSKTYSDNGYFFKFEFPIRPE